MQTFHSENIDGREVMVLYQGNDKPCHLFVRYVEPINMVVVDREYPNPRMLSADLVARLLYKFACDFLYDHEVPPDSQLWHLNHDGYPGPRKD